MNGSHCYFRYRRCRRSPPPGCRLDISSLRQLVVTAPLPKGVVLAACLLYHQPITQGAASCIEGRCGLSMAVHGVSLATKSLPPRPPNIYIRGDCPRLSARGSSISLGFKFPHPWKKLSRCEDFATTHTFYHLQLFPSQQLKPYRPGCDSLSSLSLLQQRHLA